MKTLALFNNKGGVGKTTLTVNISDALSDMGHSVLMVDADPQCNLTSFFLPEKNLDEMLDKSDTEEGSTIWSSIRPVVRGKGGIKPITPVKITSLEHLVPGDVFLADYEEELPEAWTSAFARKERGYDVTCAFSNAVRAVGKAVKADVIIYDVGPNLGPLNRAILLDADYFASPVAADLFSLRALTTVGRSLARWITDWQTVRSLATPEMLPGLLRGKPAYLGYITSAYKISSGRMATAPHDHWEKFIAPRVRDKIVSELRAVDPKLVPFASNKLGGIKNFHSLAPQAQSIGVAIGKLKGQVNSGYYAQIEEADLEFSALASEIARRMKL
ncbi:MAG: ParA family protein [Acidobacteriota bacterium]